MERNLFGNKYKGTFSSGKISVMNGGQHAIVNLDDYRQMRSHWVGLVKDQN